MGVKVIAIGNILMGDDSVGIRVLKHIQSSLKAFGIKSFIGETDVQYCISIIEDNDFIFIIDAAMLGERTGDVTVISLGEYRYYKIGYNQHSNSLLDMVYTYHKHIKGYVIGIEVKNIECSLDISTNLELSLEVISLNVMKKILELAPSNIMF